MSQAGKKARYMVIAAAALISARPSPTLADIYVIINPALTIAADDIKLIYTGDKELAGATKIKPLDNHAAAGEFLSKVLLLTAGRYESLWIKKSFRDGLIPPAVKATDDEVIAYVQSTPGAIGYVMSAPPSGVVVLKKF
jgi:ABC-type phosphate transport system substrate-binding protein